MRKSYPVALGGVLAALAVVIMTIGGLIPFATYVCPMLCALLLMLVTKICGNRVGWTWYFAVSVLSTLLAPDKEAAAVFVAMGYYPIIQPFLQRTKFRWLWKLLLFNSISVILYLLLIYVFGMMYLLSEFQELGYIGLLVTLVLGNLCFILVDKVLILFQIRLTKT